MKSRFAGKCAVCKGAIPKGSEIQYRKYAPRGQKITCMNCAPQVSQEPKAPTPHVIIYWVAKGCRKPKQIGLASAIGSALTIHDMARSATEKRGTLYIVEAPTAAHGRQLIAAHKSGQRSDIAQPGMKTVLADGRIVALGVNACLAIAGAADSIRRWDGRIASQGAVTQEQSRALNGDPFAAWNTENVFGKGLDK